MKSRKIEYRIQHKSIAAGMSLAVMILLAGCGEKDAQFLSDIRSEEVQMQEATEVVSEEVPIQDSDTEVETQETGKCYVHICGAVEQPGVYPVDRNARIYEVIVLAGGFREDACTDYLNQAAGVTDGSQIRVPTLEEAKAHGEQGFGEGGILTDTLDGEAAATANTLVNLNTATAEQLCTLPGIGSAKAAGIIAYREQTGGFHSIEELLQVDGIKTGTFEKLKDRIRVS